MVPFLEAEGEQPGPAGTTRVEKITKKKTFNFSCHWIALKALRSSLKKGHIVMLISVMAIFGYLLFFFFGCTRFQCFMFLQSEASSFSLKKSVCFVICLHSRFSLLRYEAWPLTRLLCYFHLNWRLFLGWFSFKMLSSLNESGQAKTCREVLTKILLRRAMVSDQRSNSVIPVQICLEFGKDRLDLVFCPFLPSSF